MCTQRERLLSIDARTSTYSRVAAETCQHVLICARNCCTPARTHKTETRVEPADAQRGASRSHRFAAAPLASWPPKTNKVALARAAAAKLRGPVGMLGPGTHSSPGYSAPTTPHQPPLSQTPPVGSDSVRSLPGASDPAGKPGCRAGLMDTLSEVTVANFSAMNGSSLSCESARSASRAKRVKGVEVCAHVYEHV